MSPEKWLAGLLAVIALSFIGTCLMLWHRDATDSRKEAKRRAEADARYQATQATRNNRLDNVAGKNGGTNRTGSPVGRKARGA